MVEKVVAWKTSDGQCFEDKVKAFHEEMVYLIKTLPDVSKKGFNLSSFDDALKWQRAMIEKLKELRGTLDDSERNEDDAKIVINLDKLIKSADNWLDRAEVLSKQMSGEKD